MNSSLSTVDSLFNSNNQTNTPINQSQRCSTRPENKSPSSPSFNDSEPPSYFEAIGVATSNNIILTTQNLNADSTNSSRISSTIYQLPKISIQSPKQYGKEHTNASYSQTLMNYCPNQLVYESMARNHNLPIVVTQQNLHGMLNCSNISTNNLRNLNSLESSLLKPSEPYMVWSIFTTIYCVLIGVPALIYSIKVYHYNQQGEYQKARTRSKMAKCLNIIGLFCGLFYMILGVFACLFPFK